MKKLLPILILFCAFRCLGAAAYNQITLTFTNIPTNGCTATVGVNTYRWTNAPVDFVVWLQTNGIAGSATNLARRVGALQPQYITKQTNSTNIIFSGPGLGVGIEGNYGFLTTNSLANNTNRWLLDLPFDYNFETNRTNAADQLVYGIGKYALTSSFPANASALTANFVGITNQQTITRKTLTGPFINDGTNNGTVLTNIPRAGINVAVITNANILSGTVSNAVVTNATAINGALVSLTGGILTNNTIAHAATISGTLGNLTNGYLHNPGIRNADATNTDFYGYVKIHTNDVAGAAASILLDDYWTLYGIAGREVGIENSDTGDILVRFEAGGNTVIPSPLVVSNTITSIHGVAAPTNTLNYNALSNTLAKGTNVIDGRLDFTAGARSIGNGYNAATVLGSNVIVELSGATGPATNAGFKAPGGPAFHIVQVANPARNYTLLYNSGLDAAGNKILTGHTNVDALVNFTNDPATFGLHYSMGSNAWILQWRSY